MYYYLLKFIKIVILILVKEHGLFGVEILLVLSVEMASNKILEASTKKASYLKDIQNMEL